MALIRSPAAGLKRPQKDMEVEDEEEEEEEQETMDTEIKVASKAKAKKAAKTKKRATIVEEIHESDQEMLEEAV